VVVVRLDAPLFFANTTHFEGNIKAHIEDGQAAAHSAGRKHLNSCIAKCVVVCLKAGNVLLPWHIPLVMS
jgi:MFS superfamily sulfate permease-like transporter